MEMEFKTQQELYQHILPALKTKKNAMYRQGFLYIKEEDIWNYLKETKWPKENNLSLHDVVNDILNCDDVYVDLYMKKKLSEKNRHLYFED